jgi:hypothetical protein
VPAGVRAGADVDVTVVDDVVDDDEQRTPDVDGRDPT